MNRIDKKFQELKRESKVAFMPFVVAGDPDFETSMKIVHELVESADFLEIGLPYSDPLADGPTIQAADQRALKYGMNTDRVFEFVREIRKFSDIPITLLVYANLVYRRGMEKFYADAKEASVDGILIPDLPAEEATPYVTAAKNANILPVFLVAQTTNNQRLQRILQHAEGYLYLVAVLGVTGERDELDPEVLALVQRVRQNIKLPLVVGFGISNHTHVQALQKANVDGYIVGSALIKVVEENLGSSNKILEAVREKVSSVTSG